MVFQIDDKFRVEGSLNFFTLIYEEKYFDDNAKKERTSRDQWYYSTLKDCLIAYIDKSVIGHDSAKDILSKLEEVKNILNRK